MVKSKHLTTSSLREIKEDLKMVLRCRYLDRGLELPTTLFTDDCCDDRSILTEALSELRVEDIRFRDIIDVSKISNKSELPAMESFDFPSGVKPFVVNLINGDLLLSVKFSNRKQVSLTTF